MGSSSFGGGRGASGPLGGSGSSSDKGTPPDLADYPDDPQYDLATVVQLVGVRPMTLWAWEQQLGIPRPDRQGDGTGSTVRHYSERDLVACLWLRDRILAGVTPAEAASRLLSAQGPAGESHPSGRDRGGYPPPGGRSPVNSGPIGRSTMTGNLGPWVSRTTSGPLAGNLGPRSPQPSRPFTSSLGPVRGGVSGPLPDPNTRLPAQPPTVSRGAGSSQQGWGVGTWPGSPGAAPQAGGRTDTLRIAGPPSGPLPPVSGPRSSGLVYGGPTEQGMAGEQGMVSGSRWPGAPAPSGRELRSLVPQLVRAFQTWDTFLANRLVDEALSARSVETVCVGLLQPALASVGEQWAHHELDIADEHFATNFIRARLYAIYADTPERVDGPLAVVACGPRETHDVGALMLAVFWRRAGLRVVLLGQDMDGEVLVEHVREHQPRVVCVSIATSQRVRALARIAKAVAQLSPRPLFTYGGAAFVRNPELQRKVIGVYLGDDAVTATWRVMRLLGPDRMAGGPAAPPGGPLGQVG